MQTPTKFINHELHGLLKNPCYVTILAKLAMQWSTEGNH